MPLVASDHANFDTGTDYIESFEFDGGDVDIFGNDGDVGAVEDILLPAAAARVQFMNDAVAANSTIIEQRGDSLLSLFQDHEYNNEQEDNLSIGDIETMDNLIEDLVHDDHEILPYIDTQQPASANTKMSMSDFDYMRGDNNKAYFKQEQNVENGGVRGLAARALNRVKDLGQLSDFEEADYMFATLNLLVNSSPAEQKRILALNKKSQTLLEKTGNQFPIKIPCDRKAANQLYLQNQYSLFKNCVCPPVKEIDQHSCMDIDDLLDYMFAMGTDFDLPLDHTGTKSESSFNNTKGVQELLHKQMNDIKEEVRLETCYGHIILWSDSFLLRFLRQRENSIWLLVVRICAPPGMSTSRDHMFCVAFGSSKLNHDKVMSHYIKKIKFKIRLGKMRYWHKNRVRCMVNTSFDLLMVIGDTPEKNEIIKSLHLGRFGKRSLWAGRISITKMPYCQSCFIKAVRLATSGQPITEENMNFHCRVCMGFKYETSTRAVLYDPIEEAYPRTCSDDNPTPVPSFTRVDLWSVNI